MSDPIPQRESAEKLPAGEPLARKDEPSLRPFFVLWGAQTLSLAGSHAVQFGLIWWLTARTGSATILATATLVGLVPQVVLGPIIGTLIDRWNRKLVMLLSDAIVAFASLVLAVLYALDVAHIEYVFVILFVRALAGAFHAPAMLASTSLMVPEGRLTQIQGLSQGAQGLLLVVGAPLGALLYSILPMSGLMLVDVATAFVAIVPLLFIRVPQPGPAAGVDGEEHASGKQSVWSEMVEGFCYLRERSGHVTLVLLSAGVNMLLVPAFSLLPLLVLQRLDENATQLGWISSAFGVGMLAGGVLLGTWGGFSRRIVTTLVGMIALGVAVIAVGLTPNGAFSWALGAMFAVGFIVPLVNGPVYAIMQATVAPELQGRVFTLIGSLAGATAPIGLLFAAPVAELVGVGAWYIAGGAACMVLGSVGFGLRALVRIEEGPPNRGFFRERSQTP